ncbi:hypothetical protein [Bacillus paramycoides]|uniref:hypothetical protein n=1 Tax=Bacillus paramycoides TaxID=2026194 RepID=UPI002E1F2CBD|nr:hypothetical protein [Bacillus paramycoides]
MEKQNVNQEQGKKEVTEKTQEFCVRTDGCPPYKGYKYNATFRVFPNGDAAFYRCGCSTEGN